MLIIVKQNIYAEWKMISFSECRSQNRNLQRSIRHDRVVLVLEGVRERALNTVQPDPILLINFPEIDHRFEVSPRLVYIMGEELILLLSFMFESAL